jgi:hypothetical protein
MNRDGSLSFCRGTKKMNWIVNVLLLTAITAAILLWYLLHQIFKDSPPRHPEPQPDADENETLTT